MSDRVRFDRVGKAYQRRHLGSSRLLDALRGASRDGAEVDRYWALRDVSLSIAGGETVAILGQNGSGKSTALALVAGATHPTEGRVSVRGRVAPVLALGVGFEPDLSAPENAYVNAALLGVGREELATRLPEILAFADLGDFEDTAVRHYSTGMSARLGFAVAMHVDADVLLVDEVLAVGDGAFQAKCLARIGELQREGRTMLFVTHDLANAREVCTRGVWIRDGRVECDDDVDRCLDEYAAFLAASEPR